MKSDSNWPNWFQAENQSRSSNPVSPKPPVWSQAWVSEQSQIQQSSPTHRSLRFCHLAKDGHPVFIHLWAGDKHSLWHALCVFMCVCLYVCVYVSMSVIYKAADSSGRHVNSSSVVLKSSQELAHTHTHFHFHCVLDPTHALQMLVNIPEGLITLADILCLLTLSWHCHSPLLGLLKFKAAMKKWDLHSASGLNRYQRFNNSLCPCVKAWNLWLDVKSVGNQTLPTATNCYKGQCETAIQQVMQRVKTKYY